MILFDVEVTEYFGEWEKKLRAAGCGLRALATGSSDNISYAVVLVCVSAKAGSSQLKARSYNLTTPSKKPSYPLHQHNP
jgi:hypothetical protein